jgi:hypothetical protein
LYLCQVIKQSKIKPIMTKDTKTSKGKFKVINETDGIIASPKAMTKKEAETFIKKFPDRFKLQGYYLTSNNERISPEMIKFSIIPFDNLPF